MKPDKNNYNLLTFFLLNALKLIAIAALVFLIASLLAVAGCNTSSRIRNVNKSDISASSDVNKSTETNSKTQTDKTTSSTSGNVKEVRTEDVGDMRIDFSRNGVLKIFADANGSRQIEATGVINVVDKQQRKTDIKDSSFIQILEWMQLRYEQQQRTDSLAREAMQQRISIIEKKTEKQKVPALLIIGAVVLIVAFIAIRKLLR